MARLDHPVFRVFSLSPHDSWQRRIKLDKHAVVVELEGDSDLARKELDVVAKFVDTLDAFDAKARKALLRDKSEMGLRLYIEHHLSEIPAAKIKAKLKAAPSEVTPATFVAAMVLMRVGLDPSGDEHVATFDYTLDPKLTDYVMAVRFNRRGSVVDIEMES